MNKPTNRIMLLMIIFTVGILTVVKAIDLINILGGYAIVFFSMVLVGFEVASLERNSKK